MKLTGRFKMADFLLSLSFLAVSFGLSSEVLAAVLLLCESSELEDSILTGSCSYNSNMNTSDHTFIIRQMSINNQTACHAI